MNNKFVKKSYFCPACCALYTHDDAVAQEFQCTCDSKKYDEFLIPVDEPIGKVLQLMNQKGYYTQFSCSGHLDDSDGKLCISHPYILFIVDSYTDIPWILSHPPIGMEYEVDFNGSENWYSIRVGVGTMRDPLMFDVPAAIEDDPEMITEDPCEISDEVYIKGYKKYMAPKMVLYDKILLEWAKTLPNLKKSK